MQQPRISEIFALFLLLAFAPSFAQTPQSNVLLSSQPDVVITVRKSPVGPDYVRVQMRLEDYPMDLFRRQCEAVGKYLGSSIRGLDINYQPTGASPNGKPGKIVTSTFAADGLIDSVAGKFELNAFAKAFAGAPKKYEISVLAIMFQGEKPVENMSLANWRGASADVVAQYDNSLPAIDYRVTLKTQDPDKIAIPKTLQAPTNPVQMPSKEQPKVNLIPWVVAAAVLVGLLVYFALRPYRKADSTSRRR